MSLSRRIADPLLASTFMACGLEALRTPRAPVPVTEDAEFVGDETWRGRLDPDQAIRATGAIQLAAGALLASRRCTRLAALALLVTALPTTPGGRRFWMDTPHAAQPAGRPILMRNIGLIGGLLLAVLDTGGAPSLAWRVRHRTERFDPSAPGDPGESEHHQKG